MHLHTLSLWNSQHRLDCFVSEKGRKDAKTGKARLIEVVDSARMISAGYPPQQYQALKDTAANRHGCPKDKADPQIRIFTDPYLSALRKELFQDSGAAYDVSDIRPNTMKTRSVHQTQTGFSTLYLYQNAETVVKMQWQEAYAL